MQNNSGSEKAVHCEECSLVINTKLALFVACAGPCSNSYHISCVGMRNDQLRDLSHGMVWLCRECLPAFKVWKNAQQPSSSPPATTSSVDTEISLLKSQVSVILDTLQRIKPHDTSSGIGNMFHSTSVETADVQCEMNTSYLSSTGSTQTRSNEIRQTTKDDCFSLLLTNIDSETTEQDVEMMVYRCLDAPNGDCLNVTKLVSKRMDCSLLDYVSFKIILKSKWKGLAMCRSTWPDKIEFREFRRRMFDTWKP